MLESICCKYFTFAYYVLQLCLIFLLNTYVLFIQVLFYLMLLALNNDTQILRY